MFSCNMLKLVLALNKDPRLLVLLDLLAAAPPRALSIEAVGGSLEASFFSNCDSEHQLRLVAKSSLENFDRPEL